ncbi:MAG: hypothetical protein Fur0010_08560 [Bdellovibrio sp.]
MINVLLSILVSISFAGNTPTDTKNGFKNLNEARFFWLHGQNQHLVEIKAGNWEDDIGFTAIKLGTRYRTSQNSKIGIFYQRSYGLRHDNDWQVADGNWYWLDRKKDGQDSILIDTSFKDFLNLKLVYELRMTLEQNTSVGRTFARPRVGFSYFFEKSHLILSHELTLPIEKRESSIQEQWTYLIFSYHYSPWTSFGPMMGYRQVTWESSDIFKQRTGGTYSFKESNSYIGVNFTHHHE